MSGSKVRYSRRRIRQRSQWRFVRHYWRHSVIVVLACLSIVGAVAIWHVLVHFAESDRFKIGHIKVLVDSNRVSASKVARLLAEHLNGNFFSLNLSALPSYVQQDPWVETVSFRRIWPGMLEAEVRTRKPYAMWNDSALLTPQGYIFAPPKKSFPPHLPRLFGPPDTAPQVLAQYHDLERALRKLDLYVSQLTISPQHSWRCVLDNQLKVIVGSDDVDQRINRLVVLYKEIILKSDQVALVVDLRYPDGAAIEWKPSR